MKYIFHCAQFYLVDMHKYKSVPCNDILSLLLDGLMQPLLQFRFFQDLTTNLPSGRWVSAVLSCKALKPTMGTGSSLDKSGLSA